MKKLFPVSLLALLTFSGCETIVDVDTPPHTPRLALTYTLSNQVSTAAYQQFFTVRELFVSNSQGVLDTRVLEGRRDATVQLLDDAGQVVEQFRSKGRPGYNYTNGRPDSIYGYYVPVRGFAGTPGRSYTLRASAPGFEAVESTLTLPAAPVIELASYAARQQNPNSGYADYAGRLTLSVADNAATTDYYLVYARVLDAQGRYWGSVRPDYSSNSGSGPDVNLNRFQLSESLYLYNQYPASDAGSNGQRLNLGTDVVLQYEAYNTNPPSPTLPAPAYVEVIVSSITPDTYRFYQSMQRYYDADGNPFAEPAPLFSNIRPGYGLFGGATDATYRIPL